MPEVRSGVRWYHRLDPLRDLPSRSHRPGRPDSDTASARRTGPRPRVRPARSGRCGRDRSEHPARSVRSRPDRARGAIRPGGSDRPRGCARWIRRPRWPAQPRSKPLGLRAQFTATRDAALRLVVAHVDLAKAEAAQIGGEVAKVTALGVAAIVLVLIAAMLLVLGTSLFLGEWLLGSMGWGIVHGLEACLAVAMSCIFLALAIAPQRIVRALVIGIVVGVVVGLILLTNVLNHLYAAVREALGVAVDPASAPLIAGAVLVGLARPDRRDRPGRADAWRDGRDPRRDRPRRDPARRGARRLHRHHLQRPGRGRRRHHRRVCRLDDRDGHGCRPDRASMSRPSSSASPRPRPSRPARRPSSGYRDGCRPGSGDRGSSRPRCRAREPRGRGSCRGRYPGQDQAQPGEGRGGRRRRRASSR